MISFDFISNFNTVKFVLLLSLLSCPLGCDKKLPVPDKSLVTNHQKIIDVLNKNYIKFATEISLVKERDSLDNLEKCVSDIVTELDRTMEKYDDLPALSPMKSNRYANLLVNTPLDVPVVPRKENRKLLRAIQTVQAKHFEVCTKYGLVKTEVDKTKGSGATKERVRSQ